MFSRTLFNILDAYIISIGDMHNDRERLQRALADTEAITDFALFKIDAALDDSQARQISQVGLTWLDQVHQHDGLEHTYREAARSALDD
ncbi:hypothetical protein L1889_08225 [Paenalcaligenes niemegkensis]|uniref:hypothetical protein n=1 Tax=Paenalcaligenes niemegkensis TaxID=2895469 RepID=UPI001EE808CA|nr:hypothetical protein [Paenalcaligenes niemegkensis]MCQ9616700.1 hypothetical protein [Paenalcaligenes niemegkensis]